MIASTAEMSLLYKIYISDQLNQLSTHYYAYFIIFGNL